MKFSVNWFEATAMPIWNKLLPSLDPEKILEVGSYEGMATVYLLNNLSNDKEREIYCIDSWAGGEEHVSQNIDMAQVEDFFNNNVTEALEGAPHCRLHKHKGHSDVMMVKLLDEGKFNYFDFIYIDGSHQAPDVLIDALLGFKLLKIGGVMGFDDYLWGDFKDILLRPKPAIDSFVNIFLQKIEFVHVGYQFYIKKTKS
jgi:predicted O-methyltransferase YrrM